MAAASFHLGHFAARSFSLLAEERDSLNLSSVEHLLVALMQRRLGELERICRSWLGEEVNTSQGIADLLENEESEFMPADASRVAVSRVFHRALATFDFAIRTGEFEFVPTAISLLEDCIEASEQMRHVPLWWSSVLARALIDDLWDRSLHNRLPKMPSGNDQWLELRRNFIDLVTQRQIAEIDLWPSQLAAATRVVDETDSLVVALPTSSGKTRIAELCILKCLAGERRVVYVTPLRALSAQVEVTLGRTFQPLGFSVTSVYGASGLGASDVDTMKSADIVVATPEKLDFAIRQSPEVIEDVGLIVLDEGHMIGLGEREIRYEILVQRLLRRPDSETRRIVCLSAIFTEGDPFDAFTQWIRQDREGNAIRSTWRPTRQRPATLEWQTDAARLEYKVVNENVFIPRFVETQEPKGRRKNNFPQNSSELLVASIERFLHDGHSVLVYCPIRRSVETTAEAYLNAIRQGHAESLLSEDAENKIQTAIRIGEEWLGNDHVAIRALRVGIAIHHGQLPRPFLGEIERLLRQRVLLVAVSSPTLAQGVDLSFSVLLFKSLWRNRKLIPAKEFANVIGRVGRAYVDIDGIFVLPVYETSRSNTRKRLNEFHQLVSEARKRELESGLYQLIQLCLRILQERLDLHGNALAEFVLNQQPAIDEFTTDDHEDAGLLGVVLAELDAGILALVENLDCDVSEVASRLDEALANSYWQRRLAVRPLDERVAQLAVIRGRAAHIWSRTNQSQRTGFFLASVGTESGLTITEHSKTLQALLTRATVAIEESDSDTLGASCVDLAAILFEIYPFQPRSYPGDWRPLLRAWISGEPLADVAGSDGIAFVQEALVFRLVWAIEAVRIILSSSENDEANDEVSTYVAICMTYGVPGIAAARMLEAGMESRLLAVRLASALELNFSTRHGLLQWLNAYRDSEPSELSEEERTVWQRFLALNEPSYKTWHRKQDKVEFELYDDWEVNTGETVRVVSDSSGRGAVLTADFEQLGDIDSGLPPNKFLVGTVVTDSLIAIQQFGPLTPPTWLAELMASF